MLFFPTFSVLFLCTLIALGEGRPEGNGGADRFSRASLSGKYEALFAHKGKAPAPPAHHIKVAPPTPAPIETKPPEGEEGGGQSFVRPHWSESDSKGAAKCKEKCKPPPSDASCAAVNIYDQSVPRATGPNANCCVTMKCFNTDGSFFPYHGLQGKGPLIKLLPPLTGPAAAAAAAAPTTTAKPEAAWNDKGRGMVGAHHEHTGAEVNVFATGTDDAVANAVDDDAPPAGFDDEMYNAEKDMAAEMAKMSAQMDMDMGMGDMSMKMKRDVSDSAASYATMLYGALI